MRVTEGRSKAMKSGFVSETVIGKYGTIYFFQQPQRWKERVIRGLFRGRQVMVIDHALPRDIKKDACVITWGTRSYSPEYDRMLKAMTGERGLQLVRMESGFYNSVGLGASESPPFSVCLDDAGMYFDATMPSRLEILLETLDLEREMLERAGRCIRYILDYGISKANCDPVLDPEALLGRKQKTRILVAGQVRDDEAIVRGILGRKIRCNDLAAIAREENPEAEIIYKVHPEVRAGYRKGDDPSEVSALCRVISTPCSIHSLLKTVDKIYTISSLTGFEGLLRRIPVVCFGTPFYSGWGLTEDRDRDCPRRTRPRSVEELFAIAAMVYPDYFDADTLQRISLEEVLEKLRDQGILLRKRWRGKLRLCPQGPGDGASVRTADRACTIKALAGRIRRRMRKMSSAIPDLKEQLWKIFHPSDIACLERHKMLMNFIMEINKRSNIKIHMIRSAGEHRPYRKVIIPNGLWPDIRDTAEKIPGSKKVFMEVAFFPQDAHVYFDTQGVHGYSSIRDAVLEPLDPSQKKFLQDFRAYYTAHNFVKYASARLGDFDPDSGKGKYDFNFMLVILQSESDTAFELCPFEDNQQIIDFIEACFPDRKIIFRAHPDDPNGYRIQNHNLFLPPGNTELRQLLIRAEFVVSGNSTVLLEALMHRKVCASLAEGFSTNHHVCLECHRDRNRIRELPGWEPDWEKVDRFLYLLIQRQICREFWKDEKEIHKLERELTRSGILPEDSGFKLAAG